jgi:hypothetical protein
MCAYRPTLVKYLAESPRAPMPANFHPSIINPVSCNERQWGPLAELVVHRPQTPLEEALFEANKIAVLSR